MKNRRKIAYVSGTRADFGLMTPVLRAVEKSPVLSLRVYATGMHLMPEFGNTVGEVARFFPDVVRIPARFEPGDENGMAEFGGVFLPQIASVLAKNRPDFVLLLGDRIEQLLTAITCLYLGIPTGHLHGGERTGTVDEVARCAITKLASLHFPATRQSAARLKKMGEEPWRIHVVGAPALDAIMREKLPSRGETFARLGLSDEPFILAVQHPVSEEAGEAGAQMRETLEAVKSAGMQAVIIYPNADTGGAEMIAEIEKDAGHPRFHVFRNVPHWDFLALEREATVWVGNSSAMMIESSSFKVPVVNVGTRQKGRERGGNVLDAGYNRSEIVAAIRCSLESPYRTRLRRLENPWGNGSAGMRVVRILEKLPRPEKLLGKQISY